jgi:AmmeMemoRadiSam system protein B
MVMNTRETSVAGQFYPSNPDEIHSMLEHYNQILDEHLKENDGVFHLKPRAVIVPHAGYVYSGFTANIALRLLSNSHAKRIVIIGPSHRVYLKGTSISEFDSYQTPLGALEIDKQLISELKERFELPFIPEAHHEHSTEVQIPFVKNYTPEVSVVELVYGDESPEKLAGVIEYLLEDPTTAVVISTDLSHYYDIKKANTLDSICLDAVQTINSAELHQGCEACGKIGVEAMLITAKKNGLRSILLDYRTSADASGDKSQVVGYMSAAFVE